MVFYIFWSCFFICIIFFFIACVSFYSINIFNKCSQKRDISNWQSFIIQILPKYSQISFHNYLIIGDEINKVNSEILDNYDVPEYDNNENYYINLSQNIMTNLRIFDSPLKEEDHIKIIPQQYIVDANRAILIDNCEGVFNSPFVGNVK